MRTRRTTTMIAAGATAAIVAAAAPAGGAVNTNGKTANVGITCVSSTPYGSPYGGASCNGSATLVVSGAATRSASAAKKKKNKRVSVASATFSIPSGQTGTVSFRINKKGKKALKKKKKLKTTLVVNSDHQVSAPAKVVLKLKKKHHK